MAKDSTSTRQLILNRANDIANTIGMVDFRIDYLAQSLSISPGNITYHFPRKEDISSALWHECQHSIAVSLDNYISQFIDIKQLYLLTRHIMNSLYGYRGVAAYMLGDCSVIEREKRFFRTLICAGKTRYHNIMTTLQARGYLLAFDSETIERICFKLQTTILGWWSNYAISANSGNISTMCDYYAMIALYPIESYMTTMGKEQFDDIKREITRL